MITPRIYFRDIKKVKPQTLKNYMFMLTKLNDGVEPESVEYLTDTEHVLNYIKKLSLASQRTYMICVNSVLTSINGLDDVKDVYEEKLEELNFQYDEGKKNYQKTEKEHERMCSLDELKLCADYWLEMLDEVIYNEKHHRKVWDIYRFAIIALLYTDIPPIRLDYANFHIVYDSDDLEIGKNYVLIEDDIVSFVLQEYKTSKKYNEKIYSPSTRLSKIIKEWLEINDTGFLFPNRENTAPMTSNAFGKVIPKVFEATGNKVTLNIIRHIWVSENVDHNVLEANKDLQNAMCHGASMQQQYIRV